MRYSLLLKSSRSLPALYNSISPKRFILPILYSSILWQKHSARYLTMAETAKLPDHPKKPEKKEKKDKKSQNASGPLELDPQPAYISHRIQLFEKLKKQRDEELAQKPRDKINVTLPDGRIEIGESWNTSPGDIARSISKSLYENTVIAKVNGELWDLERPLEGSCQLELLNFDNEEGKKVFWHSSAHILGEACERRFGCDLCMGPPVEDGFYYDVALPGQAAVQQSDWDPLQKIVAKAVQEKQVFERLVISKENLLEMFKSNKYKQHIINDRIPDGSSTTVYRNGPLIDLCRGPHVPHSGRVKAFQIMKNSSSYFLGDKDNDPLQRVYGVSFPDKKRLDEHNKYLEEAAKRDHRKIGKEQELFFFHDMSPGSCFLLPHGTIIFNALQAFLRKEYWKRGYQEVQSPNMYNSELWQQSGHWNYYEDGMFRFDVEKEKWALKPMNCPGHCLIFKHRDRSYRELPIRMADFGILHRNEASGALTGLTRVRRFQQDDTHIFCMEEQIEEEILGLFDFLQTVYGNFGFQIKLKLSTRPEQYLGEIETWNKAEERLQKALDVFAAQGGVQWELNPGDGAFYGPKIDITISDALKRDFQCATIQLDFQLPQRFSLEYMKPEAAQAASTLNPQQVSESKDVQSSAPPTNGAIPPSSDAVTEAAGAKEKEKEKYATKELTPGCARPVMIHRAIYGSFERFMAILCEHFAGKWPFWLSPRQILIVPVMPSANDYVLEVQKECREREFHADVDLTGNTLQKKIRTGQLAQYNFIFVIGAQEKESRTVNIRDRDDQSTQQRGEIIKLDEAITKLEELRRTRALPKMATVETA